jgi:hypothetical protein
MPSEWRLPSQTPTPGLRIELVVVPTEPSHGRTAVWPKPDFGRPFGEPDYRASAVLESSVWTDGRVRAWRFV